MCRYLFLWLAVISIDRFSKAQILKVKNDESCSSKMDSKYRVHSVFIMEYLKAIHRDVSMLADCAGFCAIAGSTECRYFAYHSTDQECIMLDQNVNVEVISRFLFQGWTYGRVLMPSKRVKDNCILIYNLLLKSRPAMFSIIL